MSMKSIVLLSGPIAVGKSSVATELVSAHGFRSIRTGPFLAALATSTGIGTSRTDLQQLGDKLDRDTEYRWVIDEVAASAFDASPDVQCWLLDCVRKAQQVAHFRAQFGSLVLHVHFTAPEGVLEARYESRRAQLTEPVLHPPYAAAICHANEVAARGLVSLADLVLDLADASPRDVALAIVSRFDQGVSNA